MPGFSGAKNRSLELEYIVANIRRCPLAAWNVNDVVCPGATAANVPLWT